MANTPSPRSLAQAKHLQLLAHDVAVSLRKDVEAATSADARMKIARALRDAVSAWDTARDACRILRNRGLPKSVAARPAGRRRSLQKDLEILDYDPETELPGEAPPEDALPENEPEDYIE